VALGLLALALGCPGAPKGPALAIHGAFAYAPVTRDEAAAYFTAVNRGPAADTLVAVSSPLAQMAMLHRETDGGMTALARAAVPAGDSLVLRVGGTHVMLMGLTRLFRPGDTVSLTLTFAHAGPMVVAAPVKAYGQ